MADVLVSPLGRAPGAVSGVYFALREEPNVEISRVVTVGTSHPDVKVAAVNYLAPLFSHLDVEYDPIHVPGSDLRDGRRNVKPYVAMVELALQNAQGDDHHVHVAVTGGRSGMGALAALATNLYGADHLWHLWVKQEIEEGGTVDKLYGLIDVAAMQNSPFLNPTVEGRDAYDVVDLPFLDLRPLHDVLWAYRRTGEIPDPGSPLARIFARAGIQNFQDVFPAGLTFAQADQILEIKEQYAQATPQERNALMVQLGEILQKAGVVEEGDRRLLIDLVNGHSAPEALFEFAQKVRKDRKGIWQWMVANKDGLQVVMSLGVLLLNALELYLKANGYIS
jgi:hypothetical protein